MPIRMECVACQLPYPVGAVFCSHCARPLTPAPESFWNKWKATIAISLLVLVVGLATITSKTKQYPGTSNLTADHQAVSAPPPDRSSDSIDSFRAKILGLPDANKLILNVEKTPVRGVVRIQVSNLWFGFQPFQRRQLTQMISNLWSSENHGDSTIVHIYDVTGREIAGTKAFGGVWIEE